MTGAVRLCLWCDRCIRSISFGRLMNTEAGSECLTTKVHIYVAVTIEFNDVVKLSINQTIDGFIQCIIKTEFHTDTSVTNKIPMCSVTLQIGPVSGQMPS